MLLINYSAVQQAVNDPLKTQTETQLCSTPAHRAGHSLQWLFFSIPQGDSGMLKHSGRRQIASLNLLFAAGEIEIYISVVMVLIHGIDPRDVTCHIPSPLQDTKSSAG